MNTEFLKDKVILVTGGTGSFGQKFVERLLKIDNYKKIIIFSRDEFKQHQMRQKLADPNDKLRFFLGDVRDLSRLERAFSEVDIVVHAAALKQVPALEYNPLEAIKTNVLGTQNVIDAALNKKVEKVLLVSTDKAVNPANLYGATKLCAEKLIISANAYRTTRFSYPFFSAVRYGNVVGSRGSIVEVIKNQKDSGTVTLTDPKMTRFWITLDQAVDLVFDALDLMRGGETFVPKLPAMRVTDLIAAMAPHCQVKVIGIRPGEKIHEVLLTEDEVRRTKDIGKHYLVEPSYKESFDGSPLAEISYLPPDFRYDSDETDKFSKEDFLNFV